MTSPPPLRLIQLTEPAATQATRFDYAPKGVGHGSAPIHCCDARFRCGSFFGATDARQSTERERRPDWLILRSDFLSNGMPGRRGGARLIFWWPRLRGGSFSGPAFTLMLRHARGYALANRGHDTRALGHRNVQHAVRYTELSPTRSRDFCRN